MAFFSAPIGQADRVDISRAPVSEYSGPTNQAETALQEFQQVEEGDLESVREDLIKLIEATREEIRDQMDFGREVLKVADYGREVIKNAKWQLEQMAVELRGTRDEGNTTQNTAAWIAPYL